MSTTSSPSPHTLHVIFFSVKFFRLSLTKRIFFLFKKFVYNFFFKKSGQYRCSRKSSIRGNVGRGWQARQAAVSKCQRSPTNQQQQLQLQLPCAEHNIESVVESIPSPDSLSSSCKRSYLIRRLQAAFLSEKSW